MTQEGSLEATIQEAVLKPLQRFADKFRRVLSEPRGEDLLLTLRQNYVAEQRLAMQLHSHTPLMPNELLRQTLAQIAAETDQHSKLLAEHIQTRGGTLPPGVGQEPGEEVSATTVWRLIATNAAAIGETSNRYQAQLGWITDPHLQELLHHLRAAKQRQRSALLDLLARIDSYAKPEIDQRHHT